MLIRIEIKKTGDLKRYWSYNIYIDGKFLDCPDLIYRMWDKKETAVRNAIKRLQKWELNK